MVSHDLSLCLLSTTTTLALSMSLPSSPSILLFNYYPPLVLHGCFSVPPTHQILAFAFIVPSVGNDLSWSWDASLALFKWLRVAPLGDLPPVTTASGAPILSHSLLHSFFLYLLLIFHQNHLFVYFSHPPMPPSPSKPPSPDTNRNMWFQKPLKGLTSPSLPSSWHNVWHSVNTQQLLDFYASWEVG